MSLDDWAEDVRECTSKYKINIHADKNEKKKNAAMDVTQTEFIPSMHTQRSKHREPRFVRPELIVSNIPGRVRMFCLSGSGLSFVDSFAVE